MSQQTTGCACECFDFRLCPDILRSCFLQLRLSGRAAATKTCASIRFLACCLLHTTYVIACGARRISTLREMAAEAEQGDSRRRASTVHKTFKGA